MVWLFMLPLKINRVHKNRETLLVLVPLLFVLSCIPIRVTREIEGYKITKDKKFKGSLPKGTMIVFEALKDAGHFHDYIEIKFQLKN